MNGRQMNLGSRLTHSLYAACRSSGARGDASTAGGRIVSSDPARSSHRRHQRRPYSLDMVFEERTARANSAELIGA